MLAGRQGINFDKSSTIKKISKVRSTVRRSAVGQKKRAYASDTKNEKGKCKSRLIRDGTRCFGKRTQCAI